jgi:hypothetical protein
VASVKYKQTYLTLDYRYLPVEAGPIVCVGRKLLLNHETGVAFIIDFIGITTPRGRLIEDHQRCYHRTDLSLLAFLSHSDVEGV